MNYTFPIIEHLDDVLPLVEGREDFAVMERGDHVVICYYRIDTETFPEIETEHDKILRECRGLTFCTKTGALLSRKFHKFFNLGERPETLIENVDFSQYHVVLEKMDGSMIVPLWLNAEIRWHTKGGLSATAQRAEAYVENNEKYVDFAKDLLQEGWSPIFEWCSQDDKIVLDYPEDQLTLLAVRRMKDGVYQSHAEVSLKAHEYNIPVVFQFDPEKVTTEQLIKEIGGEENTEGVVIRFDDGHMLKVKSEWYSNLHKVLSNCAWEYNIVRLILNGQTDDIKALLFDLQQPMAEIIEQYEKDFWAYLNDYVGKVEAKYEELVDKYGEERKDIATSPEMIKEVTPLTKMLIFNKMDNMSVRQAFLNYMDKSIARNSSWLKIKSQCDLEKLEWMGTGIEEN